MPPVRPVGGGGPDPQEPPGDGRALRQLRLHPRAVTSRPELVVYCDGGARGNPGPAAIGAVVLDPSTEPPARLATVSERIGVATNNVAEYRALVAALEAAREFPAPPYPDTGRLAAARASARRPLPGEAGAPEAVLRARQGASRRVRERRPRARAPRREHRGRRARQRRPRPRLSRCSSGTRGCRC